MGKPDSQAPALETPDRYVWASPAGDVRIQVEREAATRLRKAARTGAGGGLLIGEASEQPSRVVTIRAVEPLAWSLVMDDEERNQFEKAVNASGPRGRAVGYYRVQAGQELFLNASDLVLMKSFFPEPARIFLLLKRIPGSEPATRYFFWDGGLLRPGWTDAGLPFGRPQGDKEEPPPAAISAPATAAAPIFLDDEPPPRAPLRALWATAAVLLLAAAIPAAQRFSPAAFERARAWLAGPSRPPAAPARQSFALDVEKKLGDLVLTWNRSAPAIENAVRAVLFIRDGESERSYDVDITQLKTGIIFYSPQSGDVQFRLEVYGAGNAVAVASARVLSAALPPPLPIPPAQAPASSPPARADRTAAVRRVENSRPEPELQPRTLYFSYPRPAEPRQQPLEAPPLLAGARPSAAAPGAIVPSGVRVEAPAAAPSPPVPAAAAPKAPAPLRASDYVGPRVTRQVYPSVPAALRNMLKTENTIAVKVIIGPEGRVDRAEVVNRRGELSSYLAETALNTARMWRFEPARNGGRAVSSEMILNFRFSH